MKSEIVPLVIGISGISGSGKTFYLNKLKEILAPSICVISFDDYYKPLDEQENDAQGVTNFDLPSALYHERFKEDLLKLIEQHPVLLKKYNFENYEAPETVEIVNPAPIIVAEGLFVFEFAEVDHLLDMRIFMNADMEISLQRRLARDAAERGIPEDRSLYQWHNHVMPAWENYILPHKNRCDLVIENEGPPEHNLDRIASKLHELAHPSVKALLPRS